MANEVLNDDLRYGISALATSYRDIAEPDELLVQMNDGRMFYKRVDGQIVTAVPNYDRKTLLADMLGTNMNMDLPNNTYVSYHTLDISGKSDMSKTENMVLGTEDIEFKVPSGVHGFFVRVRGNELTNSAISMVKAIYSTTGPYDKDPDVNLVIGLTTEDSDSELTIPCGFNTLSFIPFENDIEYKIRIKAITYPKIRTALNALTDEQKAALVSMNMNNEKFESAIIDIITLVTDVASLPIYKDNGRVAMKMLFPMETLVNESHTSGSAGGIVFSDTPPDYPCLWAKLRTDI